jgi:hypothetical protein
MDPVKYKYFLGREEEATFPMYFVSLSVIEYGVGQW